MTRRAYIGAKVQRYTKVVLMLSALACMVYAYRMAPDEVVYYANGSNTYDRLVSVYCTIVTGLVYWEYHRDGLLRLVTLPVFLGCINMAYDEFIGSPVTPDWNEELTGMLIMAATLYNLIRLPKNGTQPTES